MPNSGTPLDTGRRTHVASLTSLRFFAALYVLLFHTAPGSVRAHHLGRVFVEGGYIGVSFFFVLSGFVLGWNYLGRFATGSIGRGEFWRARFARVYPVYVVGLLASAPFFIYELLRDQPSHWSALAEFSRSAGLTLTLTQAWIPTYATVWNAPSWSLSVEAFFYALFPLLAVAAIALPRRRVLWGAGAAWLVALLAPALYLFVRPDGPQYPVFNLGGYYWLDGLRYMPLPHLAEFIIGLLGARWLLDRRSDAKRPPVRDVTLPIAALAALALALIMFAAYPLYPFLHDGLLAPLFLAMIVLLAEGSGVLVRLLALPSLVLLGEASYALYLLHVPVSAWLAVVGRHTGLPLDPAASIGASLIYIPIAVATSVVVLRYVEEPARRAIRSGKLAPFRWRRSAPIAASTPATAASSE